MCCKAFFSADDVTKTKTQKTSCREDDWKSMARTRLRKFEEELQTAIETGMRSYSGHTTWNFVNGVLYCFDICSTIGEPGEMFDYLAHRWCLW
jgi:potassium channel subfamily K member 18